MIKLKRIQSVICLFLVMAFLSNAYAVGLFHKCSHKDDQTAGHLPSHDMKPAPCHQEMPEASAMQMQMDDADKAFTNDCDCTQCNTCSHFTFNFTNQLYNLNFDVKSLNNTTIPVLLANLFGFDIDHPPKHS